MSGHFESNAVSDVMSFNPRLSSPFFGTLFFGSGKAQRFASGWRRSFVFHSSSSLIWVMFANADHKPPLDPSPIIVYRSFRAGREHQRLDRRARLAAVVRDANSVARLAVNIC